MAAISLSAAAADITTNAATLAGTASDITTAQYQAIGALLSLMSARRGDSLPLMHLLSDTHKAALKEG